MFVHQFCRTLTNFVVLVHLRCLPLPLPHPEPQPLLRGHENVPIAKTPSKSPLKKKAKGVTRLHSTPVRDGCLRNPYAKTADRQYFCPPACSPKRLQVALSVAGLKNPPEWSASPSAAVAGLKNPPEWSAAAVAGLKNPAEWASAHEPNRACYCYWVAESPGIGIYF